MGRTRRRARPAHARLTTSAPRSSRAGPARLRCRPRSTGTDASRRRYSRPRCAKPPVPASRASGPGHDRRRPPAVEQLRCSTDRSLTVVHRLRSRHADPCSRGGPLAHAGTHTDSQAHSQAHAVADTAGHQGPRREPLERPARLRGAPRPGHALRVLKGIPGHIVRGRHLSAPHSCSPAGGSACRGLSLLRLQQGRG